LTLELGQGWNTLSTPITLIADSDTWGEFVALGDGLNFQIAYYWDGTIFQIAGADYDFAPCDALLVYMNSADTAPIIPSTNITPPPNKDLAHGWNLVGSAFINNEGESTVYDALISLYYAQGSNSPWGYNQVISPSFNQPGWTYIRDGATQYMVMGKGYWVDMENADQYNGQTYTPW